MVLTYLLTSFTSFYPTEIYTIYPQPLTDFVEAIKNLGTSIFTLNQVQLHGKLENIDTFFLCKQEKMFFDMIRENIIDFTKVILPYSIRSREADV